MVEGKNDILPGNPEQQVFRKETVLKKFRIGSQVFYAG
jgi:hypothetical protein